VFRTLRFTDLILSVKGMALCWHRTWHLLHVPQHAFGSIEGGESNLHSPHPDPSLTSKILQCFLTVGYFIRDALNLDSPRLCRGVVHELVMVKGKRFHASQGKRGTRAYRAPGISGKPGAGLAWTAANTLKGRHTRHKRGKEQQSSGKCCAVREAQDRKKL
jgi:hypothetical protein